MMRALLAFLLVSCSAVDDAGIWVDRNADCAAHPSRWDNGCHACGWSWTITRQETYRCVDPETVTGTCGGADCSQRDPAVLSCADGVTLRFYPGEGYATLTKGSCTEALPATFTFTRY